MRKNVAPAEGSGLRWAGQNTQLHDTRTPKPLKENQGGMAKSFRAFSFLEVQGAQALLHNTPFPTPPPTPET